MKSVLSPYLLTSKGTLVNSPYEVRECPVCGVVGAVDKRTGQCLRYKCGG